MLASQVNKTPCLCRQIADLISPIDFNPVAPHITAMSCMSTEYFSIAFVFSACNNAILGVTRNLVLQLLHKVNQVGLHKHAGVGGYLVANAQGCFLGVLVIFAVGSAAATVFACLGSHPPK